MLKIHGIKNCDTMKKAFAWLDAHGVSYDFHDYKKHGAPAGVLHAAFAQHGWEAVINRRGMTWRKLPEDVRESADARSALSLAQDHPSMIKRPLIVHNGDIVLGFDEKRYESFV